MFFRMILPFITLFSLWGCRSRRPDGEITVSCAMSLKGVTTELAEEFSRLHPEVRLRFNYSSSGRLAAQIRMGAPADCFLSASPKEMDDLEQRGLLRAGSRVVFARNRVVVVSGRGISIKGVGGLAQFSGRFALGNPASVPAGRYGKAALSNMKLFGFVRRDLVYGENVRQVLDYVVRGEVDAGVVYYTDYRIAKDRLKLVGPLPSPIPVRYPAAILRRSRDHMAAGRFLDFLKSPAATLIFQKHGFLPPEDA